MYYTHTLKNDLQRFKEACDWFSKQGFDYSRTRYKVYEKKLNKLEETVLQEDIQGLKNSFLEVNDFLKIYENLKDIEVNHWQDQLKFLFKGQEFVSNNDQARDYLFELFVASKFVQANFKVYLNSITDIIAQKNNKLIYIECKKIKSPNTIYKNIKKASVQINSRIQDGSGIGLVFIDISSVFDGGYLVSAKPSENTRKLKERMTNFLEKNISTKEIEGFFTKPMYKKIHGIFLYCRCFGLVNGDNEGFMYVANTKIIPLGAEGYSIAPLIFNQDI